MLSDRDRRFAAKVCVVLAALSLLGAFRWPFLTAEFALEFPIWVPELIGVRFRQWLIDRGEIPVGDHYLWDVMLNLFARREYLVGGAILIFSCLFPTLKILLAAATAFGDKHLAVTTRHDLALSLAQIGKWSMADVFIVGMIIVFFKAEGFHYAFHARPGVYLYATSALLGSIAIHLLDRLLAVEMEVNRREGEG